jgi:hypothetical protein
VSKKNLATKNHLVRMELLLEATALAYVHHPRLLKPLCFGNRFHLLVQVRKPNMLSNSVELF